MSIIQYPIKYKEKIERYITTPGNPVYAREAKHALAAELKRLFPLDRPEVIRNAIAALSKNERRPNVVSFSPSTKLGFFYLYVNKSIEWMKQVEETPRKLQELIDSAERFSIEMYREMQRSAKY